MLTPLSKFELTRNGTVISACPHDCPDACSIISTIENGHLVDIAGNPGHPVTQGFICRKFAAAPARIYAKDRLTHPLQRTGEKGSGEFRRIPWSEAIEIISNQWKTILEEHGPLSIVPFYGSGTEGLINGRIAGKRFFNRLGTVQLNRTICTNSGFHNLYEGVGGYYREQEIPRLIDEMLEKKETYDLAFVYLVAESFLTTNHSRIEEFGRLYPQVGLPFWVEARPESISKDKVAMLREIGCEGISVGVESGNEDLRRNKLGRNLTNERIIQAFDLLADSNIRVSANNIIGFPTETREMIFDTIELDRQINIKGVMVSFFSPYRGCTLREVCEFEGYLKDDDIAGDYRLGPSMRMPQISPDKLIGLHRTFPLYVKFPKSEWDTIRLAEQDTPSGNALFKELAQRYVKEFM